MSHFSGLNVAVIHLAGRAQDKSTAAAKNTGFWPPQRRGSQSHRSAVWHRRQITANCPTPWSWSCCGTPTAARACSHLSRRTLSSMVDHAEITHRVNLHMCSDMNDQHTNGIKKIMHNIKSKRWRQCRFCRKCVSNDGAAKLSVLTNELRAAVLYLRRRVQTVFNYVQKIRKKKRRGSFFGLTWNVHILSAHFHKFNPFNSHSR